MSDLVERLERSNEYEPLGHTGWEAAARITELEAENARLRWLIGIKGDGSLIDKFIEENAEHYARFRDRRAALAGQGDGE